MRKIDVLYTNTWDKKLWRNMGELCDRKHHAISTTYRAYRRGKNRCLTCGARIGKVKLVRLSCQEMLVDNIFTATPLFTMLKNKGVVSV